jgi:hypothetical protein
LHRGVFPINGKNLATDDVLSKLFVAGFASTGPRRSDLRLFARRTPEPRTQ